jgi:hypothetical protein
MCLRDTIAMQARRPDGSSVFGAIDRKVVQTRYIQRG